MSQWSFAFAAFAVLTALSLLGLWAFRRKPAEGREARPSRPRRWAARFYGGTCAVLYLLVVLEVVVGLFASRSDGYGVTLAGRAWFARNWQPTNTLGFRDRALPNGDSHILLVLGDSIAAGHGIEDVHERFAGQLEESLGAGWRVPVFAKPGWNLGEELAAIETCPFRPERVLLEYSLTDIETAANECGIQRPKEIIPPPPRGFRWLIGHSHLSNWVYWRYIRRDFGNRYWRFMKAAYADPEVWTAHEHLLHELVTAVHAKGADLLVTLWPDLSRVGACAPLLAKVSVFLRDEGVEVLDLSELFASRDVREMTVNAMDDHPGARSHHEAAERMFDALTSH